MSLSKTTAEQAAFDYRKIMIRTLIEECPEEYREQLMDEALEGFCSHCLRSLKSNESCHCWNDE